MSAVLEPPSDDERALIEQMKNWTDEAKAQFVKAMSDIKEGKRRVWYCTDPGRRCDGQPHAGYDYPHARGDQWPPADDEWFIWALLGGRGSGKTRSGAEFTRKVSHRVGRIALIAATGADARDTLVEGESGLEAVCAMAGEPCKYEPSKRRVTFASGSIGTIFTGEEPDRLRGPQHGFAWIDEGAHYPQIEEVWDMLLMGLRLKYPGWKPRVLLTSTPLPKKWLKERLKERRTRARRVSTYENMANLDETFRENVLARYEGTRLGRQELYGEVLNEVEGALWNGEMLQHDHEVEPRDMARIAIGVDPAGSTGKKADETGIVATGKRGAELFVLADVSGKYSPAGWADATFDLYEELDADVIVAEKNFGGEMVVEVLTRAWEDRVRKKISTGPLPRIKVTHAMKSKKVRAEPLVQMYEKQLVTHVGSVAELEDEQLTWIPGEGDSPNRIDALVWSATELFNLVTEANFGHAKKGTAGRRASSRARDKKWKP